MAANFENFLISSDFPINLRKNHQISKNYLKRSESYGQKLWGSLKTPLLAWIGLKEVEHCKKVVKTKFNKPLIMTDEDEANFETMNHCHICGNQYTDKDVRVR